MKKKLYLFLACAAVAAMVLGGCGGKDKNNDASDGSEPDQKQEEEIVYTTCIRVRLKFTRKSALVHSMLT